MSDALAAPRSQVADQVAGRRGVGLVGRLPRTRSALLGGAIVLLLLRAAIVGPLVETQSPTALDIAQKIHPPSLRHPMGTDQLGRDILSRIIYGSQASLLVALVTVVIAASAGIPIGALAGYVGGRADAALMRVMDAIMAFPALLLAIGLVAAIGPGLRGI